MCLQRGFLVCNFLPVRALLVLITHETRRKAFPNLSFSILGLKYAAGSALGRAGSRCYSG